MTVFLIEHPNLQIVMHLVISLAYTAGYLARGNLYADLMLERTEIFGEYMNMCGLILLQQFQYTDNETARAVIEGMFIACIAFIILSNISFVGLNFKHGRDNRLQSERWRKTDTHYKKRMLSRSISRYACVADGLELDISVTGAHLPTVLASVHAGQADARMALDLQIHENEQEEMNEAMEEESEDEEDF